ncbi:hypothetical protein SAMN05445850_4287 [Paraburkholderia tuberum]|uniref:Uncharacterized protein n=1 Tax=Paraburkholderia tuberum TaxID=157910 RepID=A0A1H1J704_9BURK|nr:hypothetical protein SAMN05445850_4287 [Paraburkholderia tuberum]
MLYRFWNNESQGSMQCEVIGPANSDYKFIPFIQIRLNSLDESSPANHLEIKSYIPK